MSTLDITDVFTEDTPAESLVGLRKAVAKNTETSNAALEWSVKTYHMVKPVADGMASAQREARWAVLAASCAVLLSFLGIACELAIK